MKCKVDGEEIVPYVSKISGRKYHPFFVGYCPKCDTAKTASEVIQ